MLLGSINECSGKGHCGEAVGTGAPKCSCVTAAGAGSYRDSDCMTPPEYFVTTVSPFVGPVQGATRLTIGGPGLDRIISRNHLINDWQNAKKYPALMCQFDMSSEDGNAWTLPLTPALWRATLTKKYEPSAEDAAQHHLKLPAGETVTIHGCNPCDAQGNDKNARLVVETAQGVMGFMLADLYYFDSEHDWDKITCNSPPSNVTGFAKLTLTGQTIPTPPSLAIKGVDIDLSNAQSFEYYEYETIQRVKPTKLPLRPYGGNRGPADIDRPSMITVTGSYFPTSGDFACQFYDAISLDTQCRTKALWVNKATIKCEVPMMRRARLLRLFVSDNSQQFEQVGMPLTTYSVLSIEPVCIPTLGVARVRVNGDFLLPEAGQSPQITSYCRFGKVSKTLGSTSDDKLQQYWAYHTVATPSSLVYGSLECNAPPGGVYLATSDFGLSLDACECGREGCPSCLIKWVAPIRGQNYYYGGWDSTMGPWHIATGLPEVVMRTVVVPEVYSIYPTSGFMPGGTPVTVLGRNFSSTRCGWGVNHAPTCRFGNIVTPQVSFINPNTVVCASPQLGTGKESEVMVSIAIDGQSYVEGPNFMYVKAYGVNMLRPSSSSVKGGFLVTLTGPGVEIFGNDPNSKIGPYRNTKAMSCVFVTAAGDRLITTATFLNPKQVTCGTPPSPVKQNANVYLSPNGNSADMQMSVTFAPFVFFYAPVLSKVSDPIGSIYGGNTVNILGSFFKDMDTAACKFGNQVVPARFISVQHLECTVPAVARPMSVPCRVSLNGQDFSTDAVSYHYFDVEHVIPAVFPVRGGSRVVVQAMFEGNFTLANQYCQLPYPIKSTGPDYKDEAQCRAEGGNWLALVFKLGFGTSKVLLDGYSGPLKNQIYFDVPSPIVDPKGNSITNASRHELRLTIGNLVNRAFAFPTHSLSLYDLKVPCGPPASPRTCNAWPLPLIKLGHGGNENITVNLTAERPFFGANVTCKMVRIPSPFFLNFPPGVYIWVFNQGVADKNCT